MAMVLIAPQVGRWRIKHASPAVPGDLCLHVSALCPADDRAPFAPDNQPLQAEEEVLQAAQESTAELVHAALCDNINTRGAMDALGDLIKAFNVYRSARGPGVLSKKWGGTASGGATAGRHECRESCEGAGRWWTGPRRCLI